MSWCEARTRHVHKTQFFLPLCPQTSPVVSWFYSDSDEMSPVSCVSRYRADPTTLPDARVLFLPSLCSACHWKQMKRFPKRRNALPNFTQLCVKLSPSIEIRPLSHLLVLFALHRHLFRYHRKWFLFLLSGNKVNILWVLVNKRHLRTSSDTLGSTFLRGFLIFIDQKSNWLIGEMINRLIDR